MTKRALAITTVVLFCGVTQGFAAPQDQDVFTDFESINTSVGESFDLGTSPTSATLDGDGFSGVAGIGELYFSGIRAWMINPGGTGTVDFETNASTVEFWTRLRTGANGSSVYTAYDDANQVIDSVTIDTPGPFQLLSFTGSIDRLEIVNNATGNGQMNSIDDFGYSAIPEPTSLALGLGACLALVTARRR